MDSYVSSVAACLVTATLKRIQKGSEDERNRLTVEHWASIITWAERNSSNRLPLLASIFWIARKLQFSMTDSPLVHYRLGLTTTLSPFGDL